MNQRTRTEKIQDLQTRIAQLKATPITFAALIVPTQDALRSLEAELLRLQR